MLMVLFFPPASEKGFGQHCFKCDGVSSFRSSKVQQLYFTELRQKVLRSQSCHQEALLFQLAASALQAEAGDLEPREETDSDGGEEGQERKHYFLPEDYFPSWLIKRRGRDYLLRHAPKLHSELRGLSWSQAVLQFIKESSRLQDGAVTFYRMRQDKKEKKSSILLGVARTGVHVYQEVEGKHCAMFDFAWTDIDHLTFQGSRFEIAAVGSLSLPKLAYYTHSAFHSEHVLRHLRGSHRFHISTRDAAGCVQQLEDSQAPQFHKEAYICDMTGLRQRLSCSFLTSSMSDCSAAVETGWAKEEEEEGSSSCLLKGENISFNEAELWDETEEVFVDDPAEVSWLAELLHGVSVDGPLVLPSSCWAAVTVEMKQVLRWRAAEGASAD
ncbi:FERM domain-containing protein 6-like isoform X1 [Kryptolebias marmoratus]|uniref:FERM domain-containing protein 6-like isoform X1 n=1 Tax=Kryptolebias marmoratus TaxID=37003 RepID=UPI0018AC8E8E|nr:FERM domain-containing protein 6-like isoform X1 [Kryptolebias marmoratus]